jgi:uncharacterized membrane protein YidH (DUF202 family)
LTGARDPGAGNERTALAWQRTALALVAGAFLLGRLNFERLGIYALASVVVAVPLSAWVFLESRQRYLRHAGLHRDARPRGGRAPTFLTLATITLILAELAALRAR